MSERTRRPLTSLGWHPWLRQLRAAPSVPIALGLATFFMAACLSLAPRIVDHASDADLLDRLTSTDAAQRNLAISQRNRIGISPTGDPLDQVRSHGAELIDELRERSRPVMTDQRFVIDSPRFEVTSYPDEERGSFPTTFEFRHQEDIEDHLTLIDGAMPVDQPARKLLRGPDCPTDIPAEQYRADPNDDDQCEVVIAPVFDVVLTAPTAVSMGLEVGDEVILFPDSRDGLWQQGVGQQFGRRYIVRLAGVAELSDPDLEYWFDDDNAHQPRIGEAPPPASIKLIDATGLLLEDQYVDFLRATVSVPLTFTWRYTADVERISSDEAGAIADDVDLFAPQGAVVITQLPDLLRGHLEQRALTVGIMSAVVSGLFGAAAGGLAALAILGAIRHRPTVHRVLDRGATQRQPPTDALRTAGVVAIPAAIAGWIAAKIALPDTTGAAPGWMAATAAITALAVSVAATIATVRRHEVSAARRRQREPRRLSRRTTAEALVVTLSIGAVVLLRRRGTISAVDAARDLDPLLSLAAALVAFAAALLAIRLTAPIIRAFVRAASRRRDAVWFLGARRAEFEYPSMSGPLVVMIGSIAITSFTVATEGSIERTQEARSWALIGGDYRIESTNLAVAIDTATDAATRPVDNERAEGLIADDVPIIGPAGGTFANLTALRLSDYLDDVAPEGAGGVGRDRLRDLAVASSAWDPRSDAPIPALVSTRWPASTSLRAGDIFTIELGADDQENYVALGFVETAAGTEMSSPWVLVDLDALTERIGEDRTRPNLEIGRASSSEVDQIAVWSAAEPGAAHLWSRFDALDDLAGNPYSIWVRRTLAAVTILAGAVAVLAAVAAFEISAAKRNRDLSVMRTLGLRRRGAFGVIAVEQAPMVAIPITLGTTAGLIIARLLHPALRLGRLAGADSAFAPTADLTRLATVAITLTTAVAIAIAVSAARLVRRNDGSMLRTGDHQ